MQKIFIDKGESAADIVDRVLKAQDSEVTLVIPRNAAVSGSAENFSILKSEMDTEKIELSIESVDEDALRYAKENGMEAVHPLFARAAGKTLSDIVPAGINPQPARKAAATSTGKSTGGDRRSSKAAKEEKEAVEKNKAEEMREAEAASEKSEKIVRKISLSAAAEAESEPYFSTKDSSASRRDYDAHDHSHADFTEDTPSSGRGKKFAIVGILLAVVLLGGAWGVGKVFGRATVSLEFKKVPWEYVGPVTVRTIDTAPDAAAKSLPGEVFTDHRNMTTLFPASGRASVAQKAQGTITIYNTVDKQPQALVATTRFEAPDGKIFRLAKNVTVPAATTINGKLTPGSVEANIVADQAGDAYNIAVAKLTIPGFKGTPKYDTFYGAITTALAGGLTGEHAVATADDVTAAKDRAREMLQASLTTGALRNQPGDFVVVDGASQLTVTKLVAVSSTTDIDKFGIFSEGDIKAIAFRDGDMRNLMITSAEASSSGMVLKDISINYSNPIVDFEKGTLTVTVDAKGTLTGDFNADSVKQDLIGKKVGDAKSRLLALPNLAHARISLWPFWISQIPPKTSQISIETQ